ncbi:hypothetical protein [Acidisoma cladoniae]|uniref:hypothetical protein n=1 Tax=Acidisoma cladoniae TaxID=3040935 RepID=UPI00254BD31E|nr:hypothetical protein [Acidisoma sp. PAMC 29798]
MDDIVAATPPAAPQSATDNVIALNNAMFDLYGQAGALAQQSILARHPIILGLFSGAGGQLILYRPGQPPVTAPSVPVVYQLLKSIGHSTMVLAVVAGPHLDKPDDQSWRGPIQAYRTRMQTALDSLAATAMPAEWLDNNRVILKQNIAFMDDCLAKGVITFPALQAFAEAQKAPIKLDVQWAAETQVHHWMDVIAGWKKELGPSWADTYAASNTIYVARQNNVIFSTLAQFFDKDAMNSRLILIETMGFTTTPQDMLDSLTRIISDRAVGALFFGNDRLMDYELMGGNARDALIKEATARGMTPFLPPAVPFGSHQWPMLVSTGPGATSITQLP